MARFDGEDRAGGGEGLDVGEGEVVGTSCNGFGASVWGRSVCVVLER